MTKKTGKKAASDAAKVLSDPKSTSAEKSAAGAALTQRAGPKSSAANETTSPAAAKKASKVLSNPKSTAAEKTAAASALAQAAPKAKPAKP
ncbi:MAG: hypothetical protein AB1542_07290, partial [Pseudomonadota bacterium]